MPLRNVDLRAAVHFLPCWACPPLWNRVVKPRRREVDRSPAVEGNLAFIFYCVKSKKVYLLHTALTNHTLFLSWTLFE